MKLEDIIFEFNQSQKAFYTLGAEDFTRYGKTFKSLRSLYFQMADLFEGRFAQAIGGFDNWQKLIEHEEFGPIVNSWRKELELSVRGEALDKIIEEANNPDSKNRYNANKFLVEGSWLTKEEIIQKRAERGRPSTKEVADQAFVAQKGQKKVEDDYDRLFRMN